MNPLTMRDLLKCIWQETIEYEEFTIDEIKPRLILLLSYIFSASNNLFPFALSAHVNFTRI